MTSIPVSVKGVLISPVGEVVLLMNERNEWELPGGRVEPGESPADCLAREIREELNLETEVGTQIDSYIFEVIPGKQVRIITFRCALAGPFDPALSHEHQRIGLFAPTDLPANLPQGYRKSVETALASSASALRQA